MARNHDEQRGEKRSDKRTETQADKRMSRQMLRRSRVEWDTSRDDKPHRDALEHARPPVKDRRPDDCRDREDVHDPGVQHPGP